MFSELFVATYNDKSKFFLLSPYTNQSNKTILLTVNGKVYTIILGFIEFICLVCYGTNVFSRMVSVNIAKRQHTACTNVGSPCNISPGYGTARITVRGTVDVRKAMSFYNYWCGVSRFNVDNIRSI